MTSRSGSRLQLIIWFVAAGVCGAVLSLAGAYLYLNPQIPSAESFRHVRLETPLRVFTSDGVLMGEFGERRVIPIALSDVPPLFIRALIDTEDKRFYSHNGIDFISLINDTFDLAVHREIRGGFSTITMQLARNVSLGLEQTFIRKFKEMLLALKIERELTKDEILELYMNFVAFGKRAYGAEAAALTYYGKSLKDLDLAELAMLAGIPQAPSAGNPINGPERALKRRNLVLSRMFEQGSITQAQYQEGLDAPNTARVHDPEVAANAPYAAEWVRQLVIERFGRGAYTAGYEAVATIDSTRQLAATTALREGLLRYDRRHGYRGVEGHVELPEDPADKNALVEALLAYPPRAGIDTAIVVAVDDKGFSAVSSEGDDIRVAFDLMRWARPFVDADTRGPPPTAPKDVVQPGDIVRIRQTEEGWALAQLPAIQGALVALDPRTGAVSALVGGFDFSASQYNHALQAARQPGSGFKPFVYSAALAHGVTPASMFLDAPLVFHDETLESTYRPKNVEGRYNGPTRLREALYRSINLVSMRVLMQVGAGNVLDHVARFGFDTSNFPRDTQLAIGGGTIAITPLQMAVAYAVFANGGFLIEPNVLKLVRTQSGETLYEPNYPVVCPTCEEAPSNLLASVADPSSLELTDVAPPARSGMEESAPRTLIPAKRVLDAGNAFIVNSMLQDVIRRGTGTKAKVLERGDLAGKTGTTNEADTWFNGYQRQLAASVWVGFSDHSTVGDNEYGSGTPLPIWIDFMRTALANVPEEEPELPQGVVTMKIDPRTGGEARPDQTDAVFEYFLAGHLPTAPSSSQQTDSPGETDTAVRPVDIF